MKHTSKGLVCTDIYQNDKFILGLAEKQDRATAERYSKKINQNSCSATLFYTFSMISFLKMSVKKSMVLFLWTILIKVGQALSTSCCREDF